MNKMKPLATALVALGSIGMGATAMADTAVDARIQELERQLQELKSQVSAQQQEITTNKTEMQAEIDEARPIAKGTKFTYGGYIQLDAINSDYSEGKPNNLIEDFYVPSLVPVEPLTGNADSYNSTNFSAKTSRFFFTTATKTDAGTIGTRIELDFILSGQGDERISNSWSSRLRHAFVNWEYDTNRSILAGQSWSTFLQCGGAAGCLRFRGPSRHDLRAPAPGPLDHGRTAAGS